MLGKPHSHSFTDALKVLCLVLLAVNIYPVYSAGVQRMVQLAPVTGISRMLPLLFIATLLSIATLIIAPFIRSTSLRLGLVSVVLFSIGAEAVCLTLTGEPFRARWLMLMWTERYSAADTAAGYLPAAINAIWFIAPCWLVFSMPSHPNRTAKSSWWLLLPLFGLASTYVISHARAPAAFIPPTFSFWTKSVDAAFFRPLYEGPKREVSYSGRTAPAVEKIILIIDESVRGDILELNGGWPGTTPFLAENKQSVINLGVATSIANCSSPSRMYLRTGARMSDLPDPEHLMMRRPTIWQHAKKAGFRTVYIDAFDSPFGHSGMTKSEREAIDVSIAVKNKTVHERDIEISDKVLPGVLKEPGPAFILVEKFGSHFPYSNKYPPQFLSEIRERVPVDDLDDKTKLSHSYAIAVRWSTDEFFRRLWPQMSLKNTVVLYTSDHGQSLLEGGYRNLHCSSGLTVHPGEGRVPMFAMTNVQPIRQAIEAALPFSFNRTTHFELFPTLLTWMGYESDWITENYGRSILDTSQRPPRKFFIGGENNPWADAGDVP